MKFDYLQRVLVDAQLDVDDIGACVILGRNSLNEEYYLIITTTLGFTEKILYGPVAPEINILPFNVSLSYNRFEYSQGKIEKAIDMFLNDPKKGIIYAEVVTHQDILNKIKESLNKIFPDER